MMLTDTLKQQQQQHTEVRSRSRRVQGVEKDHGGCELEALLTLLTATSQKDHEEKKAGLKEYEKAYM